MRTLKIFKPVLRECDNRVVLNIDVGLENEKILKKEKLWFSFDPLYRDSICSEVCDGIALILLYYALIGGYDIESEIPMSSRLHYTLTQQFIPQMVVMNHSAHNVELRMNTIQPDWHPSAVATAMSCGIDSLTTYYEYTSEGIPANYQLTHLTFYEQGAHHGGGRRTWEEQDRIYLAQLDKVKKFCKDIGKNLIDIRSNLDDFLNRLLWHESYDHTHTFKNIGITLLLQKLIKIYYYAAAYNLDRFSCAIDEDSAHYEKWMLPNCSTESTSFFSANNSLTRIEKIQYLSTKPETYDNVLVCYMEGTNCGKCIKCWRTMLEMDVCGVLDLYRGSFDVDTFRKEKNKYITEMISRIYREPVMKQIYEYMRTHNESIPLKCIIRGNLRRIHRLIIKK